MEIRDGNYGGTIRKRRDGRFDTTFLYNMKQPTNDYSNGDVYDMKTYVCEKTAEKKVREYIAWQKTGVRG